MDKRNKQRPKASVAVEPGAVAKKFLREPSNKRDAVENDTEPLTKFEAACRTDWGPTLQRPAWNAFHARTGRIPEPFLFVWPDKSVGP
jgi:hypothetical protein